MTTSKDINSRQTDYLIVGAGAMGMAFADEIFTRRPDLHMTIVDRRATAGGHWNDAYPFVRLHQPAAFYGVNSKQLGTGGRDLSSQSELLAYYNGVLDKFKASGRVEFLGQHNYLGNGKVSSLHIPDQIITYKVNKSIVDATYMNVEVPSTHAPKYSIDDGVTVMPLNVLPDQYDKWEEFYVIGSGKTGIDAVLFLLSAGITEEKIHWIVPNDAWFFIRESIQIGTVGKEIMRHAAYTKKATKPEDIFVNMEKSGGICRLDESISPTKWRCATVNLEELALLRKINNIIRKGRVSRITAQEIQLKKGNIIYSGKPLFVDCSADGLAKRQPTPIFSEGKITLQSILFCQQVFSAATIARIELTNLNNKKRNQILPVPHPEFKEDWPSALSVSLDNLLIVHRYIPMWMFRSRLNFMSHEPMYKYIYYSIKANLLAPGVRKAAERMKKEPQER